MFTTPMFVDLLVWIGKVTVVIVKFHVDAYFSPSCQSHRPGLCTYLCIDIPKVYTKPRSARLDSRQGGCPIWHQFCCVIQLPPKCRRREYLAIAPISQAATLCIPLDCHPKGIHKATACEITWLDTWVPDLAAVCCVVEIRVEIAADADVSPAPLLLKP